jgi:hypothetical protein
VGVPHVLLIAQTVSTACSREPVGHLAKLFKNEGNDLATPMPRVAPSDRKLAALFTDRPFEKSGVPTQAESVQPPPRKQSDKLGPMHQALTASACIENMSNLFRTSAGSSLLQIL